MTTELFVQTRQIQTWRYAACSGLAFVAHGLAGAFHNGLGYFVGILLAWLFWTVLLTPVVAFVRYSRRST
jgi:hypothetical protein